MGRCLEEEGVGWRERYSEIDNTLQELVIKCTYMEERHTHASLLSNNVCHDQQHQVIGVWDGDHH